MCIQVKAAKGADIMRLTDLTRLIVTIMVLGMCVYFAGNGRIELAAIVLAVASVISVLVDLLRKK
jgi:hypothetical protein